MDRLAEWVTNWRYVLGAAPLSLLVLLLTIPFGVYMVYLNDRHSSFDLLFTLYVVGYFLFHWLLAVPIWDRYLVIVAPYLAILFSRMLWRAISYVKLHSRFGHRHPVLITALLAILIGALLMIQVPDIASAHRGDLPVGGRPGADMGVAEMSRFLKEQPPGTVLYDHWYSWHWRYHLFDSNVYVSWFPGPTSLVEDLNVFGGGEQIRYIALPGSADALPVIRAVEEAGFKLDPISIIPQPSGNIEVVLYQISTDD